MGYLYILLSVAANTYKGYCSKKVGKYTDFVADNVHLSLIRDLVCVALGALIIAFGGIGFSMPTEGWLVCTISGMAQTVSYIVWVMALKTDAFMFASAVNNSAFIISVLAGLFIFGEELSPFKLVAVFLIIAAMCFLLRFQVETKYTPKIKDAVILLLLFLSNGLVQVSQKWFTQTLPQVSNHVFTFYTFIVAIVLLALFRLLSRYPGKKDEQLSKIKSMMPWAVVMGVLLYVVVFFQTQAAAALGAVVLYPVSCGLTLTFSCLMAWIFFGEKPTRSAVIGVVLVFFALIMSKI